MAQHGMAWLDTCRARYAQRNALLTCLRFSVARTSHSTLSTNPPHLYLHECTRDGPPSRFSSSVRPSVRLCARLTTCHSASALRSSIRLFIISECVIYRLSRTKSTSLQLVSSPSTVIMIILCFTFACSIHLISSRLVSSRPVPSHSFPPCHPLSPSHVVHFSSLDLNKINLYIPTRSPLLSLNSDLVSHYLRTSYHWFFWTNAFFTCTNQRLVLEFGNLDLDVFFSLLLLHHIFFHLSYLIL